MFCPRVDIFLTNGLIPSVWIITTIGNFPSSGDRDVGLDAFKTIVGSFKSIWVVVLYFSSSAVEMAASNRL